MKIKQHTILVSEVVEDYFDHQEEGVVGYGGKLDIRPAFQREFVYDVKQRNAVIDSMLKGFPLNVMYWVKRGEQFEVLDGQQRTISICSYVKGEYSIVISGNDKFFSNLSQEQQTKILEYPLTVYFCEGTDDETMDWFRIVNIAGEVLREQELRNAIYGGPWVESAKRYFSKPNSPAYNVGGKYLSGSAIRQDYLETAIIWFSEGKIKHFLAEHQHKPNADQLWDYFNTVIDWVRDSFPKYRSVMKGINWGRLHRLYGNDKIDVEELERKIARLLKDEEVTNKKGIYEYVFSDDEHHLNIRAFTTSMKEEKYHESEGICPSCGKKFEYKEMEGDHIDPWREGGKTEIDNLQMLCKPCNRRKGAK